MQKKGISTAIIVVLSGLLVAGCGKKTPKVVLSAKSKSLFGATWKYDAAATRNAVMTKAGKASGIKNLKDIQLKGDVKKGVDFLTAVTIRFGEDKQGRGMYFVRTIGKSIMKSTVTGWAKWNGGETELTLEPTKGNKKVRAYKVVSIAPNKLVLMSKESQTNTPEIYKR